jgi:valyl-tRNA synthetase
MTDTAATPATDLPKQYDPKQVEPRVQARWSGAKAFRATPDVRDRRYVIMMPLPNVTGALHMGHAMDNVMQDLLTRWHRMQGDNTLWQPGTDHAGIATQAVVEKRLFDLEGKTRLDIGREALVGRIWAWKDEYQARIVAQQKAMGCGCDWDRQRFTMDAVCSAAVRETFFRMFKDKLIYRGDRLVNWDCHLQTAVADDEIVVETVKGHFYYLRYPVIDPRPGEPTHVVVATTRPETMLGDTAVACHPDPRAALDEALRAAEEKHAGAPAKEKADAAKEVERLRARKESHLALLEQLAAMARDGRKIRLPLQEREIPLIADLWAKPALGSGCVKITPAHDPNDYEVWKRHKARVGIINILSPDGTLNANAGAYATLPREVARKRVVADLEAKELLEKVEEREIEVGHSDRSKTPIEPYVSKQWFVRMGDVEGGITCAPDVPGKTFTIKGLAQASIDAAKGTLRGARERPLKLSFHPDERYEATYTAWLAEKRDWCISRQLWWGHQIPVWAGAFDADGLRAALAGLPKDPGAIHAWIGTAAGEQFAADEATLRSLAGAPGLELQVCLRDEAAQAGHAAALEALGLRRDPDVLDTWFSSALWPFSTLGWPKPANARVDAGQTKLADSLDYYYPGSCLVTGRDIITLWVARMVMLGLYCLGDLPFTDVFVHANIQDGNGVRMSKTRGNGIDPLDIIESHGCDGMRYVLCEMQTGSQDIKIPVQAISPFNGEKIELMTAKVGKKGKTELRGTYVDPSNGQLIDVVGTWEGIPKAKTTSDRFDVGRNSCNKLWNLARLTFSNVPAGRPLAMTGLDPATLPLEDRWILSRLTRAVQAVQAGLEAYNPSQALAAAREFFWTELCDWYAELIKPRLRDEAQAPIARQVLVAALDQTVRLLHPMLPFITEEIWDHLNRLAPVRGIDAPLPQAALCAHADWPRARLDWLAPEVEARIDLMQTAIKGIRELRQRYAVAPSARLEARIKAPAASAATLNALRDHLTAIAGLSALTIGEQVERPRNAAIGVVGENLEVFLADVLDPVKERAKLEKQRDGLVKQIEGSKKKLSTPSFVDKAPPEVVAAERKRLADLEAQLQTVEQSLRDLG